MLSAKSFDFHSRGGINRSHRSKAFFFLFFSYHSVLGNYFPDSQYTGYGEQTNKGKESVLFRSSPCAAMVFVSCRMELAEDTWTVTVCMPSLVKVCEMLPSKVIIGFRGEVKKNHK